MMTFRFATQADCPLLAELNHQLIRDEGHRNRMSVAELEQRLSGWLNRRTRFTCASCLSCAIAAGKAWAARLWHCCAVKSGRATSG